MSGPKVDIVAMREQERRLLEAAREKRKALADKLISQIQQLQRCMEAPDAQTGDRIPEIRREYLRKLQELLEEIRKGNELLDYEQLSKEVDMLVEQCDRQIKPYLLEQEKQAQNARRREMLERQTQKLSQMTRGTIRIAAGVHEKQENADITEETVQAQIQSFQQEIRAFLSQSGMPVAKKNIMLSLHKELMEIAQSGMDDRKKSRRIFNLHEDYLQIQALAEQELSEMRYVYDRYIRECFDVAGPLQAFEQFRSKAEIEEAIKLGREAAKDQLSKEYIRRQIDEVMAKHGYDVIRSDQLREAPAEGQVLYGVNDQTAINVFVSADDQVTMRVVGIGFDEGLTGTENENLFQQQCAFCSLHPQITAELKMRGVILTTRKHLPPDRKYNKKIQTKTKQTSQTTSRAKKELKRTEKKVMYKG